MNRAGSWSWPLAAVLLLASPAAAAEPARAPAADCSAARGAQISASVERAIEPGLSGRIMVVHCGRRLLDRMVGDEDRTRRTPIGPGTKFDVGSLTKSFVATAVLRLRDQGRLELSDPLSKHVTGLPTATGTITLHELLTHSSGLPMYSGEDYEPRSLRAFLAWLRGVKLESAPGAKYAYSNPGYSVLAHIVEQRSGRTLEAFLRAEFFEPLGMASTGYLGPAPPLAVNYFADGRADGIPRDKPWRREGPYWNLYGNGGMLSTAEDLRSWFEALRSGKALSVRSTREMFTPHATMPTNASVGIGYGWRVTEDERGGWINHGGSNGESFFADVRYFADSDALMVVTLNHFDQARIQALVRAFAEAAGRRPVARA